MVTIVAGKSLQGNAGFLVDFEQKEVEHAKEMQNGAHANPGSSNTYSNHSGNQGMYPVGDVVHMEVKNEVQITDAFGRSRAVERGSKAHMSWQIQEQRSKQHKQQVGKHTVSVYEQF